MQQDSLFASDSPQQDQVAGPVTCLGKIFANAQARRDYFLAMLAEKLKDPEFRKIEGFPIGSDEDILNLSDPPYYTACPNPWISDFVLQWDSEKNSKPEGWHYHREPFAADVSEGKSDPIYNAHSYHTKVPHKAIMRYVLHYTEPGDIVFDGFCGTGMAGVAAQMCGEREVVASLGYQVKADGTILQEELDENGMAVWKPFSKLGARKTILNDLSPAATFIAYNYNTPVDAGSFELEATRILTEVENECGWMYETKHSDGKIGKINFTVYSDVFLCNECTHEVTFWDRAIDLKTAEVHDSFSCGNCGAVLRKINASRSWVSHYDKALGKTVRQVKQIPVLINFSMGSSSKRYEKVPDENDLLLLKKIESLDINNWYPTYEIPEGDKTSEPIRIGTTNAHHFYTKRNLLALSCIYAKINSSRLKFLFTGFIGGVTKLNQLHLKNYVFGGGGCNPGPRKGVIYTPSISLETPATKSMVERLKTQLRAYQAFPNTKLGDIAVSIGSAAILNGDSRLKNTLDYVFIDPPFGSNLMYSELSHTWESWLKIHTNNKEEAIENKTQRKNAEKYRHLMVECFNNIYEMLKPGRWMTVEFSNTKASVWNNIQSAITSAGFIIGNVSALDKKQGGLNAIVGNTAVKQDLVISAYKPNGGFEGRFTKEASTEEGVWDFIRTHLKYLPITKVQGQSLLFIQERDPRILFDQLVAYYVRKGYTLPIDSKEFQLGLYQRFPERDGMFFLAEQVPEYDKKKLASGELMQASLFVKDEASAIDWLRQLLKNKPQTFADINPLYMQQLNGFSKHEITLDLRELLSQNFLCYDGHDEVPDQIHSYLSSNWKELRNLAKNDPALIAKAKDRWYLPDPNKAGDLEKLREKSLLKEFEEYKAVKKKLKVFRIEAVRVGFKKLWEQQEFAALIAVAEKLPSNVLEEDPVLLMYYDQAVTLSQVDADDEW